MAIAYLSGDGQKAKEDWELYEKQGAPVRDTTWDKQYTDLTKQRLGFKDFSYDLNGDALWQQYKDTFTQQGKQASQDVMGQAAAMTGGYGNSYAATVGNQAYHNSLQQLNSIVPTLYSLALDKYNADASNLNQKLAAVTDARNQSYDMWRDGVSDYNTQLGYLYGKANDIADRDLNLYNLEYQQGQDEISNSLAERQMDLQEAGNGVTQADYYAAQSKVNKILNGDGTTDEKMVALEEWIEEAAEDYPDWLLTQFMQSTGYMDWKDRKEQEAANQKNKGFIGPISWEDQQEQIKQRLKTAWPK